MIIKYFRIIKDCQVQYLNAVVTFLANNIVIKSQRKMEICIDSSTGNNFLRLFNAIRIETHFPLIRPFGCFNFIFNSLFISVTEEFALCTTKNNKVLSANKLVLDDSSST